MKIKYGSTALITGASSGIGKAYAYACAREGLDTILVARRKDILEQIAGDIAEKNKVKSHVIVQDLTEGDAAEKIYQEVKRQKLQVNILINNAGLGIHKRFDQTDPDRINAMVVLNCCLPVALTSKFLPEMKKKKKGRSNNVVECCRTYAGAQYGSLFRK